eukprot:5168_1
MKFFLVLSLIQYSVKVQALVSCIDFIDILFESFNTEDIPCIHSCNDTNSCINEIIDCYPQTSCSIHCFGNNSCQHLTIKSQGTVDLQCNGVNSCNRITFSHHSTDNKKYLLPHIELPNPLNITANQIDIAEYFILAKRVSTPEILDDIKLSRMRCFDSGHNERRQFGAQDYKQGKGHTVLYCDDCILDSVYSFYKQLLWAMLEHKRRQIILENDLRFMYINESDRTIDEMGYHYAWDQHIYDYDKLEGRVVEYIIYGHYGNIGWHYDEDSQITMVVMISNHDMYNGGYTQMRKDENDEFIEHFGLQWGDVVIFDSQTFHQILPILNGYRHVLVIEFWNLGRSLRNGRTSVENHLLDKECIENGGGNECWREHREEEVDDDVEE